MEQLNYTDALTSIAGGANVSRVAWNGEQRLVDVNGLVYKGDATSSEVEAWIPTEEEQAATDYYVLDNARIRIPDPDIHPPKDDEDK